MPNRRQIVIGIAALPAAAAFARAAFAQGAVTGDSLATSEGDLIIHPVGHASLALINGKHVFYVDPAEQDFSGLPAPTGILVTHIHGDHYNGPNLEKLAGSAPIIAPKLVIDALPQSLKAQAILMDDHGSGELDGIPVTALPAYNSTPDRAQYHPKGNGNGYVLSFGDKKVYVAGDTEDVPEMLALKDIEVAFLPMNLPYTMTIEQAASAVKTFKPRIVYPYHYRGSDTEAFKALVGDAAEVRLVDWYGAT